MDRAQRERRIGIVVVILVLLAVVFFWMLHPHNSPFSSYVREVRLKRALGNIHQPAGDAPGSIKIFFFPRGPTTMVAAGTYFTKSDCATVETYYKQEFARHGFTYTGTNEVSKTLGRVLSFSSYDYDASLSCDDKMKSLYAITMWPNAHD